MATLFGGFGDEAAHRCFVLLVLLVYSSKELCSPFSQRLSCPGSIVQMSVPAAAATNSWVVHESLFGIPLGDALVGYHDCMSEV